MCAISCIEWISNVKIIRLNLKNTSNSIAWKVTRKVLEQNNILIEKKNIKHDTERNAGFDHFSW